jgi:hypothetical protein
MCWLKSRNYGVTDDKLSGETLRVGVLLADSDAGRKKGAGISVVGVSPWFRSCRICRSKALPSSRVWNKVKQLFQNMFKAILKNRLLKDTTVPQTRVGL